MKRSRWVDELRAAIGVTRRRRKTDGKRQQVSVRRASFETLEDRAMLAVDWGDAPDFSIGTGPGNYNTLSTESGPSHTIVAGLKLGTNVDGDSGALQNEAANADDVNGALPDDEDGLNNPAADLVLTIGAQPTVNVLVTNTSGVAATLYGWIDYNANGVFDNVAERTSVAVPNGTNNVVKTVTFPTVPIGFNGTTYARFRLSTDAAAANPTGAAANGEVEDYRATITKPTDSTADSSKTKKIADGKGGFPRGILADSDGFGGSVASIGDLDGDGVTDLAVGADEGTGSGTVYVLFMNADGTVKSNQELTSGIGGFPNGVSFVAGVASIGDMDGDGITDLAAGTGNSVHVLFMNANGTVTGSQKIASGIGGGPTFGNYGFGSAVTSLGDLDGDGVNDLAVGAQNAPSYGPNGGAVYVLFMNANGTVKASQRIGAGPATGNNAFFGSSVAALGDLDGDGLTDLAVGANGFNSFVSGAVFVLLLNANGTVKSSQMFVSGNASLDNREQLGGSVASLGDLDGDGLTDLVVGARGNSTEGSFRGAVYLLLLNADGTVKSSQRIASDIGGGPALANGDGFGRSVASLGDLDGDGQVDLAVGTSGDDTGGSERGAVYVSFLKPFNNNPVFTSPNTVNVAENNAAVLTVTATDVDLPAQTVTFSIIGGADQARFEITTGGALSFIAPPNFEAPTDTNGDNVYEVTIQANDGNGGIAAKSISVTVTPANDNPVFTSPPTVIVSENTTAVLTVTATDEDLPPQSVTFSTIGGADQAKFGITIGGVLTFNAPPIFGAPTDANGDNIYIVTVQANDGNGGLTSQTISVTVIVATDYGDAPDTGIGTGTGNYNTLLSDNGPRHTIVAGLRMGAAADGAENGVLQNAAANADDVNGALPDDENGIANPAADLMLTIGAQPTVNVRVTNTTGTAATLYGWIDYNANGVFDNATERASVAVPNGTNNAVKTLVFLSMPIGFTGTTYARFRLSSDATAANPTGAALGGEVEDYRVAITKPSDSTAEISKTKKIANGANGLPSGSLANGDKFGAAVASIGDLDGDGITDMAVGAPGEFGGATAGAVHVLLLNANGQVKSTQRIGSGIGGGPTLTVGDYFGHAVTSIGDLDGDGITDLAVGSSKDSTSGTERGALHVLFMNSNGTVKGSQKIANGIGGAPALANNDRFGISLSSIGDLDGDGVADLAAGAIGDDTGGSYRGAVHVLFMNTNGTVKGSQKIASGTGGGPALTNVDLFGSSVTSLGDLDSDGVTDLAVGAFLDDTGGNARGAVYVLLLNANGTVKGGQKIASGIGGGPALADGDSFGRSTALAGDLNGDGVQDLVVGAYQDDTGGNGRGAVHVLLLNADGTVRGSKKIANSTGGGPVLVNDDNFGSAVASLGDLDGDGRIDLAVGAERDDTGGTSRGAAYMLFLKPAVSVPGDYNLNGTVDAADYVLWRDTLGSSTDLRANGDNTGASAGVIDQADYVVWKANFGRTAAVGSGSTEIVAIATSAQLAHEQVVLGEPHAPVAQTLAEPVTAAIRLFTSQASSIFPSIVSRSSSPRLASRDLPTVAARHDNALVAWPATNSAGTRPELAATDFADLRTEPDSAGSSRELTGALDLAFASLRTSKFSRQSR